jgi:RNA 2',3'-cyclic 3'-phosphodiesterase
VPQRYFLALLPDASARAALHALPVPKGARGVHPKDLHLTLQFLGDLKAPSPQGLLDALTLPEEPVAVTLDRWEAWDGARIACATGRSTAAAQLAAILVPQLAALGYTVDPRPFKLHVTLARALPRDARRAPARALEWPIGWKSHELLLVASEEAGTAAGLPRYAIQGRRSLGR